MSSESDKSPESGEADEFAREAEQDRVGLVAEVWDFLKHNKKWWLLPILLVIVLLSALVVLSATGAAPFIYPLF